MTSENEHECENWEIREVGKKNREFDRVSTPSHLEMDCGGEENQRLTPRQNVQSSSVSTINMDECWTINIKSPASLTVHNGPVDERGFMVKGFISGVSQFLLFVY